MLEDIALNLSADVLGVDITDATWLTAAHGEFGDGRTTFNFLGKPADPTTEKRCRLSCFLNEELKEDLISAKLVAQLVVQQALAMRSTLWTR